MMTPKVHNDIQQKPFGKFDLSGAFRAFSLNGEYRTSLFTRLSESRGTLAAYSGNRSRIS